LTIGDIAADIAFVSPSRNGELCYDNQASAARHALATEGHFHTIRSTAGVHY
jgi:hypothetical protein